MTRKRGRWRPFMLSAVLAAMAATLVGAAPASAAVFTEFHAELFDNDAWGWGPPNTELKVTLRGEDGGFQGRFVTTTDGNGFWEGEFWSPINPGDRLIATDGSTSRTFIVPMISYQINRVTDVISGRAPKNSSVWVEVYGCQQPFNPEDCDTVWEDERSTNAKGRFSADTTGGYDIRGNDWVGVYWENSDGDEVFRELPAPALNVIVNNNVVFGHSVPRTAVSVWLFDSQGRQRESVRDWAETGEGYYEASFQRNERPVNIRGGDIVRSNVASDSQWKIIDSNGSFNTGNDTVSGRCFKNKLYMVFSEHPNGNSSFTTGFADNNGNFTVNVMTADGFDLQSDDIVDIGCANPQGDVQETIYEVP